MTAAELSQAHIRPRKRSVQVSPGALPEDKPVPMPAVDVESALPKSILKSPKYNADIQAAIIKKQHAVYADEPPPPQLPPAAIREFVVERPRKSHISKKSAPIVGKATTIEGYTPKITSMQAVSTRTKKKAHFSNQHETLENDSSEPLIFNSLADLMDAAGTLPLDQTDIQNAKVIEADLEFQCVAKEANDDDEEEVDSDSEPEDFHEELDDSDDENTDPDDDDFFGIDNDNNEEVVESRPPRAFLLLWNALAQWVTPQAVEYCRACRDLPTADDAPEWTAPYDSSDIGASRCAGLFSLLSMHTKSSLHDLGYAQGLMTLRTVERRLLGLLRCFKYSQPMPKLSSALTKVLTCVLLGTVLHSITTDVPDSCQQLGMSPDEYYYLTQKGILNFGAPADSE
jgi:hypothetical protein